MWIAGPFRTDPPQRAETARRGPRHNGATDMNGAPSEVRGTRFEVRGFGAGGRGDGVEGGRVPDTSAGISAGLWPPLWFGAGKAGLVSSMMDGGAPGFGRSVSSAAGKSSALQVAQWRERRKQRRLCLLMGM